MIRNRLTMQNGQPHFTTLNGRYNRKKSYQKEKNYIEKSIFEITELSAYYYEGRQPYP